MAIKTATDAADSIVTGQVPPRMKDRYVLRCINATAGESNSGNFMITLECEIVDPLIKEFDGVKYALDGLVIKYYLMLKCYEDGELDIKKTAGKLAELVGRKPNDDCLMKRLGLPQEIDDENPDVKQFIGLTFDAVLSSQERKATKPDPENPGKYIAVLDAEGKPMIFGWEIKNQTSEIHGLSKFKSNSAF
jgi:hypothetical protein